MAKPKTDFGLMEAVQRAARRVLYHGPPGTGKSTAAQAGRPDEEVNVVSLHDEMTVAELIGHFVPVGDRFVWLDGPALDAWRYGKTLVLDEIDLASGAVLSVCRALLNDARVAKITIPNPELAAMTDEEVADAVVNGRGLVSLRPGEGFKAIATMNGEPEDLDRALRERFDAVFYVGEPNPAAIAALPEGLRDTAKRTACEDDEDRRISVRTWFNFVDLAQAVGYKDAAFAVFGTRHGDVLDGLRLGGVNLDEVFAGAPGSAPVKPKVKPKAKVTVSGAALTGSESKVFAALGGSSSWGYTAPVIAERAGVSPDTARRYLTSLVERGYAIESGYKTKRYSITTEGRNALEGVTA